MSARHRRVAAIGRFAPGPRDQLAALVLAVALVAASIVGLMTQHGGTRTSARPPTPPSPSSVQETPTGPAPATKSRAKAAAAAPFHCASAARGSDGDQPVSLCIPSLRVDTSVMLLGLNSDRTVQVPPLSQVRDAGWYRYSAAPGTVGPTVILGHVDSAQYGEGVFFRLGLLHPGATVQVRRSDGGIATYRINKVQQVPKSNFPTDAVYGATSGPAIRLVTCGGQFDSATGNYLDNIIAYGTLLGLRPARPAL